jgi:hypothetical protein
LTNHYIQHKDEDVVEGVIKTLEKDTGQKIFTMKILGENEKEHSLEFVAAFESKMMMFGFIYCDYIKGRLAIKVKGNFL